MPESFDTGSAPSSAASAPAVDRGAVRQLQEQLGDEGVADLVTMFLDRIPERLARLNQAAAAGDAWTLREEANSLKGTARSFGAAEMGEIAAKIEAQSGAGSLQHARELLAELAPSFERTRPQLEQQLAG